MESGSDSSQQTVFQLCQLCRYETERSIDAVMTWSELSQSTVDWALVRPLTSLLAGTRHPSLLYALLLVRQQWLREAEDSLSFQGVNTTRAALCELLAGKLLSLYAPRSDALARALTQYHNPFSGAEASLFDSDSRPDEDELEELLQEGERFGSSALELAIETGAKRFIRCPPVQQFIEDLYNGLIIYRPSSQHSMISDDYKSDNIIEFHNFATAGLLDHYALRVPRVRRFIEFSTIVVLVFLFMTLEKVRDIEKIELAEAVFIIFSLGFAIEEAASIKERGLHVYAHQVWNMLDMGFLATFFIYFILRIVGLRHHDQGLSTLAFDVLALGGCFLFPRVCGMLLRDSVVLIGLRAMLADYIAFLGLAVLCSFGFYITFLILAKGAISAGYLAWICVKVWLGNSYIGFEIAPLIHPQLGPGLMLVFAIFTNTLLVTILISILSNTFANVTVNVVDEALFQQAVTTLDMVKGDALSEHCVPLNLIALPILLPASWFLDSRHFHQLNVFIIRATHFPILVLIHLYYRLSQHVSTGGVNLHDKESSDIWQTLPRSLRRTGLSEKLFERKVTKAGRTVEGVDARNKRDDQSSKKSSPVAIKNSDGRQALGLQATTSTSPMYASAGPTSLLSQLFGGGVAASRSSSLDTTTSVGNDEKYAAMVSKLDKIEEMVSRLVTGGLSLDKEESDIPPIVVNA